MYNFKSKGRIGYLHRTTIPPTACNSVFTGCCSPASSRFTASISATLLYVLKPFLPLTGSCAHSNNSGHLNLNRQRIYIFKEQSFAVYTGFEPVISRLTTEHSNQLSQ